MRKSWIVLGLLAGCTGGPRLPTTPHGETVLEVRGALEKGSYALGRADLARLPRRTLRGVDPATARTASWEGVSVAAIVSHGADLVNGADTVIVRTADRAAIPIPLTLVRQWRPVLADRADGEPLAAPILAWPTLEQRGIETDPRADGWWARDVVALEFVGWQKAFAPALATPDGATDVARRGSGWYADRCLRCHKLRGVGGERGPDLTTVAARLGPGTFTSILERHPGWSVRAGDQLGPQGAEDLWSFLRAVAAAGPGGARTEPATVDRGASPPSAP